jgi:hypothetical protein
MATVEKPSRDVSPKGLLGTVKQYVNLKRRIDDLTKEQSVLKTELSDLVDKQGETDDKGHIWLPLPEEVDGVVSLKRERRVSQSLDMDAAILILTQKGLAERCIKPIPTVAEDEVMAALYEGKLTEEDVDAMFPKKITWAFITSKS